jgi:hypothetical protein
VTSLDDYDLPETVDESAIERMRFVAGLMDDAVRIPGIGVRVGLDSILGIAPVSGDLVAGALSLYVVAEAARLGVSWTTLLRMLANVGVDTAVGSVPVVGDVFDVFWKANRRNVNLAVADLAGSADEGVDADTHDDAVPITIE